MTGNRKKSKAFCQNPQRAARVSPAAGSGEAEDRPILGADPTDYLSKRTNRSPRSSGTRPNGSSSVFGGKATAGAPRRSKWWCVKSLGDAGDRRGVRAEVHPDDRSHRSVAAVADPRVDVSVEPVVEAPNPMAGQLTPLDTERGGAVTIRGSSRLKRFQGDPYIPCFITSRRNRK